MEKINLENFCEQVTEWKDGKPWTARNDAYIGVQKVAEKLNEVIEKLNNLTQQN